MNHPGSFATMEPWLEELESAQSSAQVVAVVRRYLGSIPAHDFSTLPSECAPISVRIASDIDDWNLRLADAARAIWGTPADGRTLYALSNFFLRASVRLSRLRETSLAAD